ncbi:MAG TPA: hypothetical protein VGQ88_00045, partial [Burkholderiales bacterium]|nr:hypothetical protein [Burkholderiales bacterium]
MAASLTLPYPQHTLAWLQACVVLVILIAFGDYATGYELSLAVLYLVPIFVATWVLGRTHGIVMSV